MTYGNTKGTKIKECYQSTEEAKAEKYIAVYYPERYVKKYDQEVENAGSNERDFFTEFLKKKAGQHHNSNGGQKREK